MCHAPYMFQIVFPTIMLFIGGIFRELHKKNNTIDLKEKGHLQEDFSDLKNLLFIISKRIIEEIRLWHSIKFRFKNL